MNNISSKILCCMKGFSKLAFKLAVVIAIFAAIYYGIDFIFKNTLSFNARAVMSNFIVFAMIIGFVLDIVLTIVVFVLFLVIMLLLFVFFFALNIIIIVAPAAFMILRTIFAFRDDVELPEKIGTIALLVIGVVFSSIFAWFIFFSGLIFGGMHITNVLYGQTLFDTLIQIAQATSVGVLLGAIYYRTKNI